MRIVKRSTPILGDVPAPPEPGGYSLDTDFGFGSVSAPRR